MYVILILTVSSVRTHTFFGFLQNHIDIVWYSLSVVLCVHVYAYRLAYHSITIIIKP